MGCISFWGEDGRCTDRKDILLSACGLAIVRTSQVRATTSAALCAAIDLYQRDFLSIVRQIPGSVRRKICTYGLFTLRIPVTASILNVLNHCVAHKRRGRLSMVGQAATPLVGKNKKANDEIHRKCKGMTGGGPHSP